MVLKAMCNQKCYDYVQKNLVPLPSTWEINATCESPVMSTEQQTQLAFKGHGQTEEES
jgi:hypothetical protein